MKIILITTLFFSLQALALASVSLPSIFTNHMVVQQNSELTLWGWANSMEKLTISTSWDTTTIHTEGDNQANWSIQLRIPAADKKAHSITIKGSNTITVKDILFGEVWLCSGQSNMEWSPDKSIEKAEEVINSGNQPNIRLFQVPHITALYPQIDINSSWSVCTPDEVKQFSAIAYIFGREINKNLDAPIGLIHSSWGGTPAETWINKDFFEKDSSLTEAYKKINDMAWCPKEPGRTYNAMIAPIIPFQLAGVIWYQGETNTANADSYARLLKRLITNWRNEFKKELPFYYVQIAPFKHYKEETGAIVRDQQRKVLQVPNTGMVVTSDIGNINDIHPRNKIDVGTRLAKVALAKHYGISQVYSGPLYKSMSIQGKTIRIEFDHTGSGLVAKNGSLTHFTIAGANRIFKEAKAIIKDNCIIVSSPEVKMPVAVRFAWSNTAEPNLFNKEGFPASCFKTDDW